MRRLPPLLPAAAIAPLVAALLAVPAQAAPSPLESQLEPAGPAHVPVWDKGEGGERYVALGDSFVSGPGIAPQRTDVGCMRSEKNFPTVVARTLDATSFTDASCGGATTVHFAAPQSSGDYTNAPQLDALSEDTTLVTFGTMGGNDVGLVQLATACSQTDCVPPAGEDPLAEAFASVRGRLVSGLQEARRRAPDADIAVLGYGTYMTPGGCPAFFLNLVQPEEFDYLQSQIDRLSDLLEEVAAEQNVVFIDQRDIPGAIDHTVCAPITPVDQQWIRGIVTTVGGVQDGAVFHPSTAGMKATADYVVARIAEERTAPPEPQPEPVPTRAQRLAALKAKAKTVRATASCQRQGRQVRVRVTGGRGAVAKVALRVGKKRVALDRRAPWKLTSKAAKVRRLKGKVRVVVTVRDRELRHVRTLAVKRPRCAR